ncbi:hypothetical protein H4I96_07549 [Botrytis cinerea]
MCSSDIFLGLIAILFPPLAVWVKRGLCSADSLINILLCMLGFLPGLLHAWYIIAKFPDQDAQYDAIPDSENARVTYVVQQQNGTWTNAGEVRGQGGEGSSGGAVPPTYAEAVRGDHKVQSRD